MNLIKLIEQEQKDAHKNYKFHIENGNQYNLSQWFNGQKAILRKLKRKIKQAGI